MWPYLTKAEDELPKVKAEAANTPSIREQAEQARRQYGTPVAEQEPTRVYDQGSSTPRRSDFDQL